MRSVPFRQLTSGPKLPGIFEPCGYPSEAAFRGVNTSGIRVPTASQRGIHVSTACSLPPRFRTDMFFRA
jgi:hypothetical protein